jgi:hypothetical protein
VKIVVVIAIVVVCLIWLVSCGAIIGAIGGEDATTATTAPPAAQSYARVTELRDAAVKAGYPCPKWKLHAIDDKPKFSMEAGQCSDDDVFSVYASDEARQVQVDQSTGTVIMVTGGNWILNIPESQRERMAAALGGEVVDEGESDANAEPTTEPEPAEPETAKIGDKVRDDDYQFTVTKIRCGVSRVGSSYVNEKAQGQFCLVSLRVKNVGKAPIHFSDENQALVDTKGREYSPDDEAWIYMDDSDPYAEINPGNVLKTTVPFDVPKRAKPDYLLLKAGVFGFSEGVRVKL